MTPRSREKAPVKALGLAACLGAAWSSTPGCLQFDPFECENAFQCDRGGGLGGVCQPSGFCSYPDASCPTTGQRYDPSAGNGLGGQCVESPGESTDSGIATATGGSSESDATDSQTEATQGTSTGDSSTGDPPCGAAGQTCCPGDGCEAGLECRGGGCTCVAEVVAGRRHTCIIDLDGAVRCWGANDFGQLGNAAEAFESEPVEVSNAFGASMGALELTADRQTCVSRSDDAVFCWGDNTAGKADPANPAEIVVPTQLMGLTGLSGLSAGGSHTCAAGPAGVVATCWGDNTLGQLGGVMPGPGPHQLSGAVELVELAAGATHVCGRTQPGAVYCWGDNARGQLAQDPMMLPTSGNLVQVAVPPVSQIVAGDHFNCVRTTDDVRCWGRGDLGELGDGMGLDQTSPVVATLPDDVTVQRLAAGPRHVCALTTQGELYCWGSNDKGQLMLTPDPMGNDLYTFAPRKLETDVGFLSITTGATHSCGLTDQGSVACWGTNTEGQIGDGTTAYAFAPTEVSLTCP